jgi:putative phosphoribosyl transferase
MQTIFRNRREAGQRLAARLGAIRQSRGRRGVGFVARGAPVAFEVAQRHRAPLDVFVVRKLGVPGHEELAMGAIATGGVQVVNSEVLDGLGIPAEVIDAVAARLEQELKRRELAYRGHRRPPELRGKTVLLVDDGIATGATMRAAVRAVRLHGAAWLVVASANGVVLGVRRTGC